MYWLYLQMMQGLIDNPVMEYEHLAGHMTYPTLETCTK